jgi:hypothetical protein
MTLITGHIGRVLRAIVLVVAVSLTVAACTARSYDSKPMGTDYMGTHFSVMMDPTQGPGPGVRREAE